ncbi:MAG: signal peptide peptidase SppA, partial [Phycisphaeraceae bacterium]
QSPGGAVPASDEILFAINRLRTERNLPVVASYGDVAASGGYYVSCQADRIFAQPTSITGSIGVIAPAFTVEKLLEKIGVQPEIVTSSLANEKDLGTPLRAWTEEDRERIQGILNSIQEQFISVIVEGRKDVLSADEVRSLATGAIFTAQDALDARLVDEIGYIGSAIDHAVSLGDFELEDPPAVLYQPRAGLGALLTAQARTQTSAPTPDRIDASTIRQWANELSVPKLMYMWQQ